MILLLLQTNNMIYSPPISRTLVTEKQGEPEVGLISPQDLNSVSNYTYPERTLGIDRERRHSTYIHTYVVVSESSSTVSSTKAVKHRVRLGSKE